MFSKSRFSNKSFLIAGVYLKRCTVNLKKEIPMVSLSPCHFKMLEKDKALGIGLELDSKNHRTKKMLEKTSSGVYTDDGDLSAQDEIIAALSSEPSCKEDEEPVYQFENKKGLECLLHTWLLAQLNAVASNAGSEFNTLVLPNESLLHFEVKGYKSGTYGKVPASCNGALGNKIKSRELRAEIFYVLTFSEESLHGGKNNAYELTLEAIDQQNNNTEAVCQLFAKLNSGDPVSFYFVKERGSTQGFNSNVSSLSWMGTTASDVINSRYFLHNYFHLNVFSYCIAPFHVEFVYHGHWAYNLCPQVHACAHAAISVHMDKNTNRRNNNEI